MAVLNKRLEAIAAYLKQVGRDLARGDSTEHTHRRALQNLVEALASGSTCTNEPKKTTDAGHPDMKVSQGETPLGFIETKDIGVDMDEVEKSDQMERYHKALPNLILTDYLEFRWFQFGKEIKSARLAVVDRKNKLSRIEGAGEDFLALFDNFIEAEVFTIASPKELAKRMAALARLVRRLISEVFQAEPDKGDLHDQLKAFRETLIPDLDPEKFADMYAQTICYGLFASKCNTEQASVFARETAADHLPKTNPFLRQLFHHIVGPDLNERVKWAVEQLVFLLNKADIGAILKDFGKRTRQEDPVVHFYETFLSAYDPKLRKSRGVYYTPEPIVSFIIRSVDHLLKTKFNKPMGVADPAVLTLDPATGTATFLHTDVKLIYERVREHGQYGAWSGYVRDNLLPRIFGFELLMAPYAVAHLKLGLLLQETGYDFGSDERLGIFLTNTLEEAAKKSDMLFAQWISEESNAASAIKKVKPVMVVFGNPPYSGHSANRSNLEVPIEIRDEYTGKDGLPHVRTRLETKTFIGRLLDDYYFVDGKPLGERNPKWLQDDYVKFIRWGQWRIEKTGAGILAYISNNGYLDNPTFRGMRQQLMQAFTEIYILDLHGSSKKKETAPDGSKDENVFDIQQGVCIGIFGKEPGKTGPAQVYHADVYGDRQSKYKFLLSEDIASVSWTKLTPSTPAYLFVPQDTRRKAEYEAGWRTTAAMPVSVLGFQSHRDWFAIGFREDEVLSRITVLRDDGVSDTEAKERFGLSDNRDWHLKDARAILRADARWRSRLIRCHYRPFDHRWCYFGEAAMDYPRAELLDNVAGRPNLCLNIVRQTKMDAWRHAVVTDAPAPAVFVELKDGSSVVPLYLYPAQQKGQHRLGETETSPWPAGKDGRRPNLSPKFIAEMEAKLGLKFVPEQPEAESLRPSAVSTFGPEDVFDYIYAVFHSPTYRKRYAEFLKIDFPRVPLTSDKKLFWKLVALGHELVAMHLLESPTVNDLVTKYPKKGSDTVEKVDYDDNKARVLVNDEQYFEGVKPEWWEFHIGGYQVLQKWLKDRKGRKLSNDDITHYQRVVVAIKETIRLMAEIDRTVPKWPIT